MTIIAVIAVLCLIIFLIGGLIPRNGIAQHHGIPNISPVEVKKRRDAGETIVLIDVRTPSEYAEKHINRSLSIPLDQLEREAVIKIPDKNALIVVYCLTGRRSSKGAGILAGMGYRNIYNMGAMMKWPDKAELVYK